MVIEAMSIPFGRVSTTLQGNFTGSRGLVSNSSFLLSGSALSGEIRRPGELFSRETWYGGGQRMFTMVDGYRASLVEIDIGQVNGQSLLCWQIQGGDWSVYTSGNCCVEKLRLIYLVPPFPVIDFFLNFRSKRLRRTRIINFS